MEELQFERELGAAPQCLFGLEADVAVGVIVDFAQGAGQIVLRRLVGLGGQLPGARHHILETEGRCDAGQAQRHREERSKKMR